MLPDSFGKTISESKIETGLHVMAIKRADHWVYGPEYNTVDQVGDTLIAAGLRIGKWAII